MFHCDLDYDDYYQDEQADAGVKDSKCKYMDLVIGLTVGFGVATFTLGKLHFKVTHIVRVLFKLQVFFTFGEECK